MKAIVFCATQRTGSSLLVDDFFNVLGERAVNAEYLTTRLFEQRDVRSWDALWEETIKKNNVNGVTAVKIMFHYLAYISDFMKGVMPPKDIKSILEFDVARLQLFATFFSEATWVHIRRDDVASQAVSVFFASRTDVWERRTDLTETGSRKAAPEYDGPSLISIVDQLRQEAAQWPRFFSHFRIQPINIEYNQLTDSYPAYLYPIYSALGFKPDDVAPSRRMHKLGDQVNRLYADRLRIEYKKARGVSL